MMKERLDLIINKLNLSGRSFEKAVGLTNGSYASIGDGVGADKLKKILIAFPQISADWLLTGEGSMLKTEQSGTASTDNARLWSMVESQQRQLEAQARQIEAQTQIIEGLAKNVGVAAAGGAVKAGE